MFGDCVQCISTLKGCDPLKEKCSATTKTCTVQCTPATASVDCPKNRDRCCYILLFKYLGNSSG